MKNIFLILVLTFAQTTLASHFNSTSIKANNFAWAEDLEHISDAIWPYDILSIGHSMQSYQNYSANSPYWHDGLDIRGNANQKVYASVSGKIVNIENYRPGNHLYWEVAILDDNGFVWKYHHVDKKSISKKVYDSYKNGSKIKQGEYIGDIVHWPVSAYGEKYHHIHLLIIDGKGRYVNPFKLLPPLEDTFSPIIKKVGIFNSKRKLVRGNFVKGEHGIYINTYDLIFNNKYKLPPYKISYNLDRGKEVVVWKFDYLPGSTNDLIYISDFYINETCGNYHCRNFNINLNFDIKSSKATKLFNLSKGKHTIRITVEDILGNYSKKTYTYFTR